MTDEPKVSLLMPVYNGERFLRRAMDSILAQTFGGFELVIVEDGSTDGTAGILAGYQDRRIVSLRNEANLGVAASAIRGWAVCRGEWIARMDADDEAHPDRLARQVAYLAAHPQVGVLGTQVDVVDEDGRVLRLFRKPCEPRQVDWAMLFDTPIAHSTVMMRRAIVEDVGGYDPACRQAQDYDLWERLWGRTRFANLPESLLRYRVHGGSVTHHHRGAQSENLVGIHRRLHSRLLREELPADTIRLLHRCQRDPDYAPGREDADRIVAHILRIYAAFAQQEPWEGRGPDRVLEDALRRVSAIVGGRAWTRRLPMGLRRVVRRLRQRWRIGSQAGRYGV